MPNEHADKVAPFYDYFNPVIDVLKEMGGNGSKSDIESRVIEKMKLSEEQVGYTYDNNDKSIVIDRIAWAFTYLKKGGILKSGGRAIYILADKKQTGIDVPERFTEEEQKVRDRLVERIPECLHTLIKDGFAAAANKWNVRG